MQSNGAQESQLTVSGGRSSISETENSQSTSFSKDCIEHLLGLMKTVTSTKVNPDTVNAACNCATAIYKLIDVNLRYSKYGRGR